MGVLILCFSVSKGHTCPETDLIHSESRDCARNIGKEKSSAATGEMYPLHVSPNVPQRRPKGWPGLRAQGRLQRACATRPIEKTGDSSTPLRMTYLAITIGETCRSSVGKNCHPEEAWVQRPRNASVSLDTRLSSCPERACIELIEMSKGHPGRRRIYCSIGSSPCDLHVSIPERQHIRLQRETEAATDASTSLRMTCIGTNARVRDRAVR